MYDETEKITVRLPKETLRRVDFLVQIGDFPSRSEAIRTALRDLIYSRADVVMEHLSKVEQMDLLMVRFEERKRLSHR